MVFKKILTIVIVLGVLIGVQGCQMALDDGVTDGAGTVKLNITDAPIDGADVDGVYITITSIQYNINDEWIEWEDFSGPQTHNLLELQNGNFQLLGNASLPAGHYSQIRFMLDSVEEGTTTDNPGCYISFVDGSTSTLYIPSGSRTGYKAVNAFNVPKNGTVELTADFDLRKAVVKTGSNKYILKPTIRLVANDQAGAIAGGISGTSNYTDIIVMAYEDSTYSDTETQVSTENTTLFSGAVTSAKVADQSGYKLAFLAEGLYDLVVTGYNGDQLGEVLGIVEDVTVTAEKVTSQNIDLDQL